MVSNKLRLACLKPRFECILSRHKIKKNEAITPFFFVFDSKNDNFVNSFILIPVLLSASVLATLFSLCLFSLESVFHF